MGRNSSIRPGFGFGGFFPDLRIGIGQDHSREILIIHSLGWQEEKGAAPLRAITAVTWIVHAATWTHVEGAIAGWVVSSAAVAVFAAYGIARLVTGRFGALIVPAGAALSFLAAPANYGLDKVKASPAGLLAIIGSFLLLGLGTALALMKERRRPAAAHIVRKP